MVWAGGSCGVGIEHNSGGGPPPDPSVHGIMFDGQSLAVGGAGLPLLSTTPHPTNLTFIGGPRSDLDELYALKPLAEDNEVAPDGGTNRGETPCSGAANHAHVLTGKTFLCSTVGHGGYRIAWLTKRRKSGRRF